MITSHFGSKKYSDCFEKHYSIYRRIIGYRIAALETEGGKMAGRVCPWWLGYVLANPLRRFIHNPDRILGNFIKPGMVVLDVGCAMGFFSLPMAGMVRPGGRVVCVDLQEKMIRSLRRRAARAGLSKIIEPRICRELTLGIEDLTDRIDFVLAFHVVHEVRDVPRFMTEIYSVLKREQRLFVVEPKNHVSAEEFEKTISETQEAGFRISNRPVHKHDRAAVFTKH
jgi:2-polyprenyl-3-methyl-5-hydroxy-6-metoxy-1,4-benzoquinol methylase